MIFGQWDAGSARKVRQFMLAPTFLADYDGKQPEWDALGFFTYKRTYSRVTCACEDPTTCGHSTEEYWQTCKRVVEGVYMIQKIHCHNFRLPWNEAKSQKSAQSMYKRMWAFKFTPPGRGLWMMGTNQVYIKGSASLLNCGFCSSKDLDTDFSGPFTFLMDMSMLGVGIGADLKGRGKVKLITPTFTDEPFVVGDTREGWVDLLRVILESFVGKTKYPTTVDYRPVRERGSAIRGFGGIASGAAPLINLMAEVSKVLLPFGVTLVTSQETPWVVTTTFEGTGPDQKITSSQIADVFNLIGVCVVAGGLRRTAEILFGDKDDTEFRNLKNPSQIVKWGAELTLLERELEDSYDEALATKIEGLKGNIAAHPLNTHRWASNNSIFATVGQDYTEVAESIARNGEPGMVWLDTMQRYSRMKDPEDNKDYRALGGNPCAEQTLESFEGCNLVESFPFHHDTLEDYLLTLKSAYLYAKTVTLVPTHNSKSNAIMMRNRRIGCSMSGIQQAIEKLGRREFLRWCDEGYKYIQQLDTIYSEWLCIPRSIKTTSVKPSGSVSLLAGSTPGIHYAHSEYYIRNVRVAGTSPLVPACIEAGYTVEPDTYAPDTFVVSFPMKTKSFSKGKREVSIWEQFSNAAALQEFWADNMVSITVSFSTKAQVKVLDDGSQYVWRDLDAVLPSDTICLDARGEPVVTRDERGDIAKCLEVYEDKLKSISLLPLSTHGYVQAPYIEISEATYQEMIAKVKPLVLDGAHHETEDKFCTTDVCMLKLETPNTVN